MGWIVFHKNGKINYKIGIIGAIAACLGAILGAYAITYVPGAIFKKVIAGVMVVVLLITILKNHGLEEQNRAPLSLFRESIGYVSLFLLVFIVGFLGQVRVFSLTMS